MTYTLNRPFFGRFKLIFIHFWAFIFTPKNAKIQVIDSRLRQLADQGYFHSMAKKEEKKEPKKEVEIPKKKGQYTAEEITVLEGLEAVRRRPGMYIGGTGLEGLHHLVTEIFDNSRDEAMAGFCNYIEIVLLPGKRVRVADNGRGIPIDIHKKTGVSALETVMTVLHAGGKFGTGGYEVSGGLHGVGASVVNALSVYAKAEVHRDGAAYVQEYARGKTKGKVKKVAASKLNGTIITFEPDTEIFKDIKFDFNLITEHMRQQAYLVKKLRIVIIDAREVKDKIPEDGFFYFSELSIEAPSMAFYFEGGLVSLIKFYNSHLKSIHENIFYVEKEHVEAGQDKIGVEIALQYVDDISSRIVPFANNIYNSEGGTQMTGFKSALTRVLNNYAKKNNFLKEVDGNFTGEDVLEGLTVAVSVKMHEIQFEGQTKSKLGSPEARGAVETVFGDAFSAFFEENPDDAKYIINKIILALRARKAAKAAKDSVMRKGALEGLTLPGKLADCSTRNPDEAELFIVEGESAGGSGKQGRDRRTQAILPLKGKILNVEKARLDKILGSNEVKSLIIAIGTSIGENFDLSNLRYKKIIIATDADVDGAHITTLLLTLFYRYFRPIIEAGNLFIAQPPLFKIRKGKEISYAYTDEEKNKLTKGLKVAGSEETAKEEGEEAEEKEKSKKEIKAYIQRYKGLGEMNPEELWETTMDPARRTLKQVTIEDAKEGDKTFEILMGDEVAPRKAFIQTNAKLAEVDI